MSCHTMLSSIHWCVCSFHLISIFYSNHSVPNNSLLVSFILFDINSFHVFSCHPSTFKSIQSYLYFSLVAYPLFVHRLYCFQIEFFVAVSWYTYACARPHGRKWGPMCQVMLCRLVVNPHTHANLHICPGACSHVHTFVHAVPCASFFRQVAPLAQLIAKWLRSAFSYWLISIWFSLPVATASSWFDCFWSWKNKFHL